MSDPHAASRNRSPWIAWYGQDFRDGVVEMSDAAAGVYAKLLSYQIVKGSIPDPKRDVNGCAKAAVTTPQKLLRVWREIEGKFVPCDGERLENPRCSQEIAIRDGIRASRSAGAKITNERRAQRSAQRPVERSASRARSTSPSTSPILEVSKPSVSQGSKLPGPAENGFARFWEAYGHKVDKADASKAWAKAIKRADPETILREAQWHAANRGPVPHAATWLNGSRWEDSHEAILAEAKRFSGAKPTPPRYVPDKKPQDFSLESTRAKAERERAEAQKAREKAEKLNQEFIANAQKMAGDGAVNGLVEALNRAVKR